MTLWPRLVVVWLGALIVHAQSGTESPVGIGMELLGRLDRLPSLRDAIKTASVSSYDRTGGNDDGFSGKYSFVRKDAEGLVLADLTGPGVIYRIWTPTPTDDLLEFFFDGEIQPRLALEFRQLFLGKHPAFPAPLAGFGVGGYYSYVPLAFAKSCVVRIRAPKMQFYQINYAIYAPETKLATFHWPLAEDEAAEREKACQLWNKVGSDLSTNTVPPGARLEHTARSVQIGPRSTETLFQTEQGGRIAGLLLSPASALVGKARDLLLRISFDGEPAAVICPAGDFFGYAWGQPAMRSLLVGTVGETNYCYWPMPFDRSARVEMVSERSSPLELRAEIISATVPRQTNEGKFYALWRRENPTTLGQPYTFLETEGRGQLVGVILQAQGFESGKTLFFEGDDETTLDGEMVIHGTGSEDFFNGGWYDVPDRWEKQLSLPLSGCLTYAKHLGRTGAYRFFLGDAYTYRRSIRQTIEHAGEKNSIRTDYCSVTCFYSAERPTAQLIVPGLAERAVKDLDEVVFPAWWQLPIHAWSFDRASLSRKKEKVSGEEVRFLSLAATGQDWFGPHFLAPVCAVPASGVYAVYVEVLKGPAQGKIQLFQNENPVGEALDLYAERPEKSPRLFLGRLPLSEGQNNLMIKLVGQSEKSSGMGLDLISVICARAP